MGTGAVDIHQARFANQWELGGLMSKTPRPDGILLGERRDFLFLKRFVAVAPNKTRREIGNTLIVAPTRGGKGLLAVSQLLSWQHSVVVNDIKGDLFTQTAGYRATRGNVYVIDPRGVGHRYDPLRGLHSEDALLSAASHLLYKPGEGEGAIFTQRATVMLTQLFLVARMAGYLPLPFLRQIIRVGLRDAATWVNTISPELATQFLDVRFDQANFTDKFLLSAWSTLSTNMRCLLTETVVRCFAGSDFIPEELMQTDIPITVYLRWSERDLLAQAPLVRLLWGSIINDLITIYDNNQGKGCQPVLLLVDEAGRTAIPSLCDHAATVAGRRLSFWISVQSLSQLEVIYGKARAQVLKDNMENQTYYRPADLATAQQIQDRLGKQSAYAHSQTLREGEETSEGRTEQGIPLMTAQEIMQMKDDEIIGFHRRLPPFKAHRVDWRRHKTLSQKQKLPAPKLPTLPPLTDLQAPLAGSDPEYINPDKRN